MESNSKETTPADNSTTKETTSENSSKETAAENSEKETTEENTSKDDESAEKSPKKSKPEKGSKKSPSKDSPPKKPLHASYKFKFHRKGQPLHSAAKVIVMNVYYKLKQEHPEQTLSELLSMTSTLTGVSITSIKRMDAEFRTEGVLSTHGLTRPARKNKSTRLVKYSDFTLSSIMKIVEAFKERNEMPSSVKVAKIVNDHPDLPNLHVRTIRRLLKDLGIVLPKRKRALKLPIGNTSPRPTANLSPRPPKQNANLTPRPKLNANPTVGPSANLMAGPSANLTGGPNVNLTAGQSLFGMFNTPNPSCLHQSNFQVPPQSQKNCVSMNNKFTMINHTYEYVMNQHNGNHNNC